MLRRLIREHVKLDLRLGAAGPAGDVIGVRRQIEDHDVTLWAIQMFWRSASPRNRLPLVVAHLHNALASILASLDHAASTGSATGAGPAPVPELVEGSRLTKGRA